MVGSVAQMVVTSLHTDIAPVQMVVTSLHTNIAPVQMVVAASPISHPRVHLAGSYRKSRDHVSYVTRSRVNRHVLSYQKVRARQCHLQQPEAPPRPSPRGGSLYLLCFRVFDVAPSPWRRLGWGSYVVWYAPPATLTELRLHSPGLRAWPTTLGNAPTNIATL